MKYIPILLLASCATTTAIHKTGWYEVEASRGYQVKFKGYDKYITLPVDTLKPGHKVHMTKINRY